MVSPDSRVVQITVEDDDICEDTESFGVLLDSSDPAVLLPRPFSPITLLDSSGTGCEHVSSSDYVLLLALCMCEMCCNIMLYLPCYRSGNQLAARHLQCG